MTNKNTNYISEERLVEIVQGTYCGFDEGVAIAAELLASRAEVERLTMGATKHRQTEATYLVVRDENTRLRAELRRMSEWHDQIADTVPCDVAGPHYGIVEWHRMVFAERDAARSQLHADDQRAWEALGKPEGTHDTTNVQRLCAEVERLRSRVGWLNHLDTAEGRAMHASEVLRVDCEQLRADLRVALELLQAHGEPPDWLRRAWLRGDPEDDTTPFHTWNRRYGALLARHKETNQ